MGSADRPSADGSCGFRPITAFSTRTWDAQIEADSKAGKLDGLISEALADYNAGKAREL